MVGRVGRIASALLAGALPFAVIAANNDTDTTTTTQGAGGSSTVKVDVQGQSGKFSVYEESQGKNSGVQITMDALREVDADGNTVGASGSVKHSINSFATQDFTVLDPETVELGSVAATKISFSSPISTIGKIRVDTYIMSEDGMVGPPSEEWSVSRGDLKWNIALEEWSWCGCSKGRTVEEGAFIELDITVRSMASGGNATSKGDKSLDLGGGLNMELSNQVLVDGSWQNMSMGYPMVSTKGSSTTLTFRFPRFTSEALYDPVIGGFEQGGTSGSDGSTGGTSGSDGSTGGTSGSDGSSGTDGSSGSTGSSGSSDSAGDAGSSGSDGTPTETNGASGRGLLACSLVALAVRLL